MDAMNKMSDVKDALFYRELNAKLIRENRELKAENCNLINNINFDKDKFINELKAENRHLKADYDNDIDASYELDDKHIKIIHDLEAENDSLQDQLKDAVNDYELLANSNSVK